MSRSRSDWQTTPDFHPEFGFLCPSPRRRRGIRVAIFAVATTMAISATMGLAIANRTDGEGLASMAQPTMAQPTDGQPPVAASAAAGAATRAQESCKPNAAEDPAALFLNPACGSNKLHAHHGARAANRVATVVLGRTDAVPAETTATPAPVRAPAIGSPQPNIAHAEKSVDLTTTAERTVPPKKPKALNAPIALTSPGRDSIRQNVPLDAPTAYAYAPRPGREAYDPYRGSNGPFGWLR